MTSLMKWQKLTARMTAKTVPSAAAGERTVVSVNACSLACRRSWPVSRAHAHSPAAGPVHGADWPSFRTSRRRAWPIIGRSSGTRPARAEFAARIERQAEPDAAEHVARDDPGSREHGRGSSPAAAARRSNRRSGRSCRCAMPADRPRRALRATVSPDALDRAGDRRVELPRASPEHRASRPSGDRLIAVAALSVRSILACSTQAGQRMALAVRDDVDHALDQLAARPPRSGSAEIDHRLRRVEQVDALPGRRDRRSSRPAGCACRRCVGVR